MLDPSEVELVEDEKLYIGDWVKVKESVLFPTHQWGMQLLLTKGLQQAAARIKLTGQAIDKQHSGIRYID
ncbi:hypothetical protein AgCh_000273 [Apium graveolens]